MSKIFIALGIALLLIANLNCKGQKVNKQIMEKLAEEEYKYVTSYSTKPDYRMQVNKQGCRLIIETYAEDYRFTENRGESMMLPFNILIVKSGLQRVRVKIYPKEGETYLTKYAHVQIVIYYAPDKNVRMSDYQKIDSFNLPQGLESQKLPYYEGVLEFTANVPFNYSEILDKAKDLKDVPNLRQKVEEKYKEIQNIAKNNDFEGYVRNHLFSFGRTSNTTYQTLDDLKRNYQDGNPYGMVNPTVLDKEFLPFDDAELQFYADGKVVALWHKGILQSGLDMKYKYKKEEGGIGKGRNADPLFLYMPEGSNQLQIW